MSMAVERAVKEKRGAARVTPVRPDLWRRNHARGALRRIQGEGLTGDPERIRTADLHLDRVAC